MSASRKAHPFPIGRVSQAQNRVGLEYQGTTQALTINAPNVAMPVRSSVAQQVSVNRFQFSRKLKFLRTYGLAPGNPVLQAVTQRVVSPQRVARPRPTIVGGKRSGPFSVAKTPASSRPGYMAAPKRFPKALPVRRNTYSPPVYGEN